MNDVIRNSCLGIGLAAVLLSAGCGYHFAGGPGTNPYPPEITTLVIKSARNNTQIAGIEVEFTNALRREFAMDSRLKPVRSAGDAVLKTVVAEFVDSPAAYKADGKELTRSGTLKVACNLETADAAKVMWKNNLHATANYDVTDSISETVTNRQRAITRMIGDLVPRIRRSMYDDF